MIPKIIHIIWVGPEKIPQREIEFYCEMKDMHWDYKFMMWKDHQYPFEMPDWMQKVYDTHYADKNWAFCADVLRLWVVYKYGGLYCDIDFKPLQRLDHFLQYDGLFCYHPSQADDYTIVNGVFGAEKEHPIMKHLVDAVKDSWWVGPEWMGREVKTFFNLPYETDQAVVKQRLYGFGFEYYDWKLFELNFMKHFALYSWR